MRTTLTIDADVAQKLKLKMASKKLTLKEAVNQALRAGLAPDAEEVRSQFRVEPHACGLKPGVDPDKLNQLVDDLEVEARAGKLAE